MLTPHLGEHAAARLEFIVASKGGTTWDRYVGAIRPWFTHAATGALRAFPPDSPTFFMWLKAAAERDRGYAQTKSRCVAIDALCHAADLPTPTEHAIVRTFRDGVRRAKGFARRGQVTAVLRCQLPQLSPLRAASPAAPLGNSPRRRSRGRPGPSPGLQRRRSCATIRHAAFMLDGALRYDDTREGQLGDILFFEDVLDVGVFGSKTDPLRVGQTAQIPRSDSRGAGPGLQGSAALTSQVRAGLLRLSELSADIIAAVGTRLSASYPQDHAGTEAFATWPQELQLLARPLYERGLRAHLLPYYGPWMWEPIGPESDLSRTSSTAQFQRAAHAAFRDAGQVIPRLGSHSFRRGRAAELFHGGITPGDLSRVLRHRSPLSSLPYVPESARVTAAGAAMRDAAFRSAGASASTAPARRGGHRRRGADSGRRNIPN